MVKFEDMGNQRSTYRAALNSMRMGFAQLEKLVPPPRNESWGDTWRSRYAEQLLEQAIVLKLARVVSALAALDILILGGFIAEQGNLQRVIDEAIEDILFLALSPTNGLHSKLHDEFLSAFWLEDFSDPSDPVGSANSRPMIPRKKIRAFVHRSSSLPNPSQADAVAKSLYSVYSGFVHGAAQHVMELYDERRGRFQLSGLNSHQRYTDYVRDAQNYYYRGLIAVAMAAKALGDEDTLKLISVATSTFVDVIGLSKLEKKP